MMVWSGFAVCLFYLLDTVNELWSWATGVISDRFIILKSYWVMWYSFRYQGWRSSTLTHVSSYRLREAEGCRRNAQQRRDGWTPKADYSSRFKPAHHDEDLTARHLRCPGFQRGFFLTGPRRAWGKAIHIKAHSHIEGLRVTNDTAERGVSWCSHLVYDLRRTRMGDNSRFHEGLLRWKVFRMF